MMRATKPCDAIPCEKGVYMVLNPAFKQEPRFMLKGVGGFFKSRDPNVSIDELRRNYVKDSQIIYIGKAGSTNGNATLQSRLRQYLRFGEGRNVGHYGGRLIWQLENHENLIICWKTVNEGDPRMIEKDYLSNFERKFGVIPFANLTK